MIAGQEKFLQEAIFKGMRLNKEDYPDQFMNMEELGNNYKKAEVIQRIRYYLQEGDAIPFAKLIENQDWKGLIRAAQSLRKKSQPIDKRI